MGAPAALLAPQRRALLEPVLGAQARRARLFRAPGTADIERLTRQKGIRKGFGASHLAAKGYQYDDLCPPVSTDAEARRARDGRCLHAFCIVRSPAKMRC